MASASAAAPSADQPSHNKAGKLLGLNHLLGTPSKAAVEKCLNIVFASRNEPPQFAIELIMETMSLGQKEAQEAFDALQACIAAVVEEGTIADLKALFDAAEAEGVSVNGKLKQLIGQILNGKSAVLVEASAFSRPSLPLLLDMDWYIDMKKSSNVVNSMNIPSVSVQLLVSGIEDNTSSNSDSDSANNTLQTISVDFSKESLNTMIDGLTKIKDQLRKMG
jgi:hypothetical protein